MTTLLREPNHQISIPNITTQSVVRLGFVRLCDAAPLIIAHEKGLFEKHGVRVVLSREVGWATIRDKIVYKELEMAQALGPMLFSAALGIDSIKVPCLTGLVLNLNGNTIVMSEKLREKGISTLKDLKHDIRHSGSWQRHLFGVVSGYSTHNFLMRTWLASGGIDPDNDVQIVNLPPDQMFRSIASGNLSGFCVGEPWGSLAVLKNVGWRAATSLDIFPGHPEKVLMTTQSFAESNREQYEAMIAAIYEACAYCDAIENRSELINIVARKEYLDCEERFLEASLQGDFGFSHPNVDAQRNHFIFNRFDANVPSMDKANWIMEQMSKSDLFQGHPVLSSQAVSEIFRQDIFESALKRVSKD